MSSSIDFEGSQANGDDPIALLFKKFTRLVETDPQVRDALPIDEVAALTADVPIGQILETVMDRYADRPAIGVRRLEIGADPVTGEMVRRLLPEPAHQRADRCQRRLPGGAEGRRRRVAAAVQRTDRQVRRRPQPGRFVELMGTSGQSKSKVV